VAGPGPGGLDGSDHHYNFAQKILQVGQNSTLGLAMWGLGNLAQVSYRTLVAQFAGQLLGQPPATLQDVADRWNAFFWHAYTTHLAPVHQRVQALQGQAIRTPTEDNELQFLVRSFSGGFCVGGNLLHERTPAAFEIRYDPTRTAPQPVQPLQIGSSNFWGCPNLIDAEAGGKHDTTKLCPHRIIIGTRGAAQAAVSPRCLANQFLAGNGFNLIPLASDQDSEKSAVLQRPALFVKTFRHARAKLSASVTELDPRDAETLVRLVFEEADCLVLDPLEPRQPLCRTTQR
jgi:hypothetical protein